MAEEQQAEHEVVKHAEHAEEHDPLHHIRDGVIFGVDAAGGVKWKPYDEHGHVIGTYMPKTIGPMKLEFTKHMFSLTLVAALILAMGVIVSRKVLAGLQQNKAPHGALANFIESFIMFVRDDIVEPIGGHHLGHYTPIFITYFFLIWFCNMLGMVPDFGLGLWGTATGNPGVTIALALSVYGFVWILGVANQGPVNYVLHLVPPGTPWWLWPLMFILELLGPAVKCVILAVRLFANMIAGHLIIGTVLGAATFGGALSAGITVLMLGIGVPLALGISMLEVLVCFLQAYVFTLLAVIFVGAAVHPEH